MKKLIVFMIIFLFPFISHAVLVDNGNGTISDTITGLMWRKNDNGIYITKTAAMDYVNYTYSGYSDWRLPNRHELGGLLVTNHYIVSGSISLWTNQSDSHGDFCVYYSATSGEFSMPWCGTAKVLPVRAGIYPLFVLKSGSGSGSVTSNIAGIICGTACTANYTYGTKVTLMATPDANSTFTGWSMDCIGVGACEETMIENASGDARRVTATFVLRGDINNDGAVTLADAILALQVVSGVTPIVSMDKLADINSDGKIGLAEVIYILQKVAGMR